MTRDRTRILIVDDEEIVRESLSAWLEKDGYSVHAASDGDAAIERIKQERWTILIVDLKMPGTDGLQVLEAARGIQPEAVAVVMTAFATVGTAVAAMKAGAHDYLVKPFDPEELSLMVRKIAARQALQRENLLLRQVLRREYRFKDVIGKAPAMETVFDLARTAAHSRSPVLITGERGTGKRLLARAIHAESPQRDGPFVAVACAALGETLLRSELFGHEEEATAGGTLLRKGKLEVADGGTILLDEVGSLGAQVQTDLLRVLDERRFVRTGGEEPIAARARVVATTSRPIHKAAQAGAFNRDVYRRLSAISIQVPPLRDRRNDIPLLVEHLLERLRVETERDIASVSPDAMRLLIACNWPGNVQELREVLERSMAVAGGGVIQAADLGLAPAGAAVPDEDDVLVSLEDVERRHIASVLQRTQHNISRAARVLGIDRATLYNKMRRYRLGRDGSFGSDPSSAPETG